MTEVRDSITGRLQTAPIVPLIQADDPAVAKETADALVAGGLTVLEVVLRTESALNCLTQIRHAVPNAIVGAGTVLSRDQAKLAVEAGASFIVSPGLDIDTVEFALDSGLPIFPGISTPTELQRAFNCGIRIVKFFPASQSGGIGMLKALGSVFRNVRFMPTGGVSLDNLGGYLSLDSVLACGGSWLTPTAIVAARDFDAITQLAKDSIAVADEARGPQ